MKLGQADTRKLTRSSLILRDPRRAGVLSGEMKALAQIVGSHQHHSTGTDMEAFAIFLKIFANHRIGRDMAAAIDDCLGDTAMTPDVDLGQYHRVLDAGIGIHTDITEKQGTANFGTRDDAAT